MCVRQAILDRSLQNDDNYVAVSYLIMIYHNFQQ